jgi:hypothetical protein
VVRNTAPVGTVTGIGLIRKPSEERGETNSRDEGKSPSRLSRVPLLPDGGIAERRRAMPSLLLCCVGRRPKSFSNQHEQLENGRSERRPCHTAVTTRCGSGELTGDGSRRFPVVSPVRESLRDSQVRPLSDWGSSGRRFKSCQPDSALPQVKGDDGKPRQTPMGIHRGMYPNRYSFLAPSRSSAEKVARASLTSSSAAPGHTHHCGRCVRLTFGGQVAFR